MSWEKRKTLQFERNKFCKHLCDAEQLQHNSEEKIALVKCAADQFGCLGILGIDLQHGKLQTHLWTL